MTRSLPLSETALGASELRTGRRKGFRCRWRRRVGWEVPGAAARSTLPSLPPPRSFRSGALGAFPSLAALF